MGLINLGFFCLGAVVTIKVGENGAPIKIFRFIKKCPRQYFKIKGIVEISEQILLVVFEDVLQ